MTTCKARLTQPYSPSPVPWSTETTNAPLFRSDVLKMDIEFAEYDALDALSEAFPSSAGQQLPLGQLMIEIHLFPGRISAEQYLSW